MNEAEEFLKNERGWSKISRGLFDFNGLAEILEQFAEHRIKQEREKWEKELEGWIKIDPTKKDSIPNEPVWVFTIKEKKVVFVDKGEYIPLNWCSHYALVEKPKQPSKTKH